MTEEEYRAELIAEANATAETIGCTLREAFVAEVVERLREAEEVPDVEHCPETVTGPRQRRVEVDAFAYDDADDSVHLFLAIRDGGEAVPPTLVFSDARDQGFRRLQAVWDLARNGWLEANIEESRPLWSLARDLRNRQQPSALRLHILSDRRLSERVRSIPSDTAEDGTKVQFQIWDIARLYRIHQAASARDDLVVDFSGVGGGGLPVLPATASSADYDAYLAVVPADVLADMFIEHGSRLLEGNVRTYLGRRGNVNKSIERTIEQEPHRFFAYNNGIAATASAVDVRWREDGTRRLISASDLQIVNGAQTTASIAVARRDRKADLSSVSVPMKLSVVKPEVAAKLIPEISRSANSQNAVRKSDFFANHEFHRRMEEISRRLLATAVGGSQVQTHWYYERARGQWLNDQSGMRKSERDAFQRLNPRTQLITKTDLAIVELAFAGTPHIACTGAEKSFDAFAKRITEDWESDVRRREYGDGWFRSAVARTMLFRTAERLVSKAEWYGGGGERRPIVAHTMARLAKLATEVSGGGSLDWQRIWAAQEVVPSLQQQIIVTAKAVADVLRSPSNLGQSLTEWAKKQACTAQTGQVHVPVVDGFATYVMTPEDIRDETKTERSAGAVDEGLATQMRVINFPNGAWANLLEFARAEGISVSPLDLKAIAPVRRGLIPSEAQAKRLAALLDRCESAGFSARREQAQAK